MNTPTERALNFLSCGAFTFSGNLVIPKLLAIFELPYRLARPKLLFSCPRTSGARAHYMNLGSASSLSVLYKTFRCKCCFVLVLLGKERGREQSSRKWYKEADHQSKTEIPNIIRRAFKKEIKNSHQDLRGIEIPSSSAHVIKAKKNWPVRVTLFL